MVHKDNINGKRRVMKIIINKALALSILVLCTMTTQSLFGMQTNDENLLLNDNQLVVNNETSLENLLFDAARDNKPEEIKRLVVELKVDIEAQGNSGSTPLHIAAQHNSCDAMKMLLQLGAKVDSRNIFESTPLHFACDYDQYDAALLLIDAGANIETPNKYLSKPLHVAAAGNSWRIIKLLFRKGVNIDSQNIQLWTPLHVAADFGSFEAFKLLVQLGADVTIKSSKDMTPYDHATQHDNSILYKNYLENVKNYNDDGSIVAITEENASVIPDYIGLATIKQNICDINYFFNNQHLIPQDEFWCSPYLLALVLNKKTSLAEINYLKLNDLSEKDYKNKEFCTLLIKKNTLEPLQKDIFTDIVCITNGTTHEKSKQ